MMTTFTVETKLQKILENREITLALVPWGKGFRNVALLKGKKYQYTRGKTINKTLEKKNLIYIGNQS